MQRAVRLIHASVGADGLGLGLHSPAWPRGGCICVLIAERRIPADLFSTDPSRGEQVGWLGVRRNRWGLQRDSLAYSRANGDAMQCSVGLPTVAQPTNSGS